MQTGAYVSLGILPLYITNLFESNLLKSGFVARELTVERSRVFSRGAIIWTLEDWTQADFQLSGGGFPLDELDSPVI